MDLDQSSTHWVSSIQEESAGAVRLVCDCGLQLVGTPEVAFSAWTSHIKVVDPGLYQLLAPEDDRP